jgi:hypothetical protein
MVEAQWERFQDNKYCYDDPAQMTPSISTEEFSSLFEVLNILKWRNEIETGPDDGGSKHLWNVCQFLPDNMVHHLTRWSYSHSSPWEPEISPTMFTGRTLNT